MDHIAIMKKSWGLTDRILSGEKKIESRWYVSRHTPWNRVNPGDAVYFKNSGEQVRIMASVDKVLQFSDLTLDKVLSILTEYGKLDGIRESELPEFLRLFKDKKYCILIFLKDVQEISPFDVSKKGFGLMSAWMTVEDIEKIKRR